MRINEVCSKAICPCCHGTGWLAVHDDRGHVERRDLCTHCMGQGEVASELAPDQTVLRLEPKSRQ